MIQPMLITQLHTQTHISHIFTHANLIPYTQRIREVIAGRLPYMKVFKSRPNPESTFSAKSRSNFCDSENLFAMCLGRDGLIYSKYIFVHGCVGPAHTLGWFPQKVSCGLCLLLKTQEKKSGEFAFATGSKTQVRLAFPKALCLKLYKN